MSTLKLNKVEACKDNSILDLPVFEDGENQTFASASPKLKMRFEA